MSTEIVKNGQIYFFRKNKVDLENPNVTITVTDAVATNNGQDYVSLMRDRKNTTAWISTGSTDAANTSVEFNLNDERTLNDIIMIGHNFKDFTLEYWTGITWQLITTVVANTEDVSFFTGINVITSKVRFTITAAQVVDEDKFLKQFIFTERIVTGQLQGWPEIRKPRHNSNKKISRMLSGKVHVTESLGAFSCDLRVKFWNIADDLNMVEDIYFRREGVLMWLSGNKESQFAFAARGYRQEDIVLVRPTNDYIPEWFKGTYSTGLKISMRLEESIS